VAVPASGGDRPRAGRLRAKVAIWERDPDTAASAAAEVGGLGIPTDVRDADAVDDALARTAAELGTVSILVNNAGGVFLSPLLETTENGFDALYRANLKHVILCTQRVARAMVAAGSAGSVINVTSIEGVRQLPVRRLRRREGRRDQLHQDRRARAGPERIRVNALAPTSP